MQLKERFPLYDEDLTTLSPFEILGVSHDVDEIALKRKYRRLALTYHSDKVEDIEDNAVKQAILDIFPVIKRAYNQICVKLEFDAKDDFALPIFDDTDASAPVSTSRALVVSDACVYSFNDLAQASQLSTDALVQECINNPTFALKILRNNCANQFSNSQLCSICEKNEAAALLVMQKPELAGKLCGYQLKAIAKLSAQLCQVVLRDYERALDGRDFYQLMQDYQGFEIDGFYQSSVLECWQAYRQLRFYKTGQEIDINLLTRVARLRRYDIDSICRDNPALHALIIQNIETVDVIDVAKACDLLKDSDDKVIKILRQASERDIYGFQLVWIGHRAQTPAVAASILERQEFRDVLSAPQINQLLLRSPNSAAVIANDPFAQLKVNSYRKLLQYDGADEDGGFDINLLVRQSGLRYSSDYETLFTTNSHLVPYVFEIKDRSFYPYERMKIVRNSESAICEAFERCPDYFNAEEIIKASQQHARFRDKLLEHPERLENFRGEDLFALLSQFGMFTSVVMENRTLFARLESYLTLVKGIECLEQGGAAVLPEKVEKLSEQEMGERYHRHGLWHQGNEHFGQALSCFLLALQCQFTPGYDTIVDGFEQREYPILQLMQNELAEVALESVFAGYMRLTAETVTSEVKQYLSSLISRGVLDFFFEHSYQLFYKKVQQAEEAAGDGEGLEPDQILALLNEVPLFSALMAVIADNRDISDNDAIAMLAMAYINLRLGGIEEAWRYFEFAMEYDNDALNDYDYFEIAQLAQCIFAEGQENTDPKSIKPYFHRLSSFLPYLVRAARTVPNAKTMLQCLRNNDLDRATPNPDATDWQKQFFAQYLESVADIFAIFPKEKQEYCAKFLGLLKYYQHLPAHTKSQQALLSFFVQANQYEDLKPDVVTLLLAYAKKDACFLQSLMDHTVLVRALGASRFMQLLQKLNKLPQQEAVLDYVVDLFVQMCRDHNGSMPDSQSALLLQLVSNKANTAFARKVLDQADLRLVFSVEQQSQLAIDLNIVPSASLFDALLQTLLRDLAQGQQDRVASYIQQVAIANPSLYQKLIELPLLYQRVPIDTCISRVFSTQHLPHNQDSRDFLLKMLAENATNLAAHGGVDALLTQFQSQHDFTHLVIAEPRLFNLASSENKILWLKTLDYIPVDEASQHGVLDCCEAAMGQGHHQQGNAISLLNQLFARDASFDQKLAGKVVLYDQIKLDLFPGDVSHLNQHAQSIIHQSRYLKKMELSYFRAQQDDEALQRYMAEIRDQAQVLAEQQLHPKAKQHAEFVAAIVAMQQKVLRLQTKHNHTENSPAVVALRICAEEMLVAARQYMRDSREDEAKAQQKLGQKIQAATQKAYPELKKHRGAGYVFANLGVALAGVLTGGLPYFIALIVHKVKSKHWGFWYKTKSVKVMQAAQKEFEKELQQDRLNATLAATAA